MKKRVLIFDDDPEILLVCKVILEQKNYIVSTRICCDDVIDDIKKVNPGLILMDLRIPEIGGENAVGLIKKNRDTMHIPVILFSADSAVEHALKRTGASGFLKKPFEIEDLLKVVESHTPK